MVYPARVAADEGAVAVRHGLLALAVWPALLDGAMLYDARALETTLDRRERRKHRGVVDHARAWWRRQIGSGLLARFFRVNKVFEISHFRIFFV